MRRLSASVAAVCALLLAGCGGSTHHPASVLPAPVTAGASAHAAPAPAVKAQVVSGHICDPKDYVTGCITQPAPAADAARAASAGSTGAQGVDFAWSCPLGSARDFGASYLSYDTSKNWSRGCVDAFHHAHKATVAVWEAGASDAEGSYSLGYNQAKTAASQVAALGAAPHQPLLLAIDCDCAPSLLVNYFRGANAAEPGRIDAYGGYYQLLYLSQHHLVGHANWQTYAWSGGLWLPASIAPLEQYLNSTSVDYDRAIAAYYGQWPYHAVKPPPKIACFGAHWQHSSLCLRVRAQALHLGARRTQELGYLKVSISNASRLQAQLGTLAHQLTVIVGRAALELRKHEWSALKISAGNAGSVQARIVPLQSRLNPIEARARLEQARAALDLKQLEQLLGQYGYHPHH